MELIVGTPEAKAAFQREWIWFLEIHHEGEGREVEDFHGDALE